MSLTLYREDGMTEALGAGVSPAESSSPEALPPKLAAARAIG